MNAELDMQVEDGAELAPESHSTGIAARWGTAVDAGFVAVPNVLVRFQKPLGLTCSEMVVLLNLLMHWWAEGKNPFARTDTIVRRTGLNLRTVQRCLQSLARKGFIAKTKRGDGKMAYDLEGLRTRLESFAPHDPWYRPGLMGLDGSTIGEPSGHPHPGGAVAGRRSNGGAANPRPAN